MTSIIEYLFGAASFMPHGYCLLWRPDLVALHAVSDVIIALSYFTIPIGLWYFARNRADLKFRGVFFLFAAFIMLCGMTHLIDIATLWTPAYGLQGITKALTAAVSLVAAYTIWPIIPRALAIPGLASLRDANRTMRRRMQVEQALVFERTAELGAAHREIEAFTYAAAHELRTPLRSINGFCATLAEDHSIQLGAVGGETVDRIHAASIKMAGLIDDLLIMTRLALRPLQRGRVDLSAKVRSIARELRKEEPERSAEFIVEDGLWVRGDPELLRITLTHLLKNAWKFTSRKAHAVIEFGSHDDEGQSWFFIRDNGVGFDMDYAGKLFEPFERLHPAGEFPGNGIGLAIAARIIQRHGGEMKAEGVPGQGATITFSLAREAATQVQHHERCHSTG